EPDARAAHDLGQPRAATAPPARPAAPAGGARGGDVTRGAPLAAAKRPAYAPIEGAGPGAPPRGRGVGCGTAGHEQVRFDAGESPRNLVVESGLPGNRPVHWLPPLQGPSGQPLLQLAGAAGVVIRGFVFDGGDRLNGLVRLEGDCPGLKLDGVEF